MPSIIKVDQIQSDLGTVNVSSNLQFSSGFTMRSPTLTTPTIATPTFTGQATIPTIDLTGGQIKFPATQSASSDGNTLDDYEEGTFTPAFFSDGDNVQITFSVAARYVKIGRYVWFCALCTRNQSSVTSGSYYVTGLPFAPATSNPTINLGGLSWFDNGGVTTDYLAATYVEASGSRLFFTQLTNPTQQQSARYVQAQNLSNNRPIYITGSYMTND